MGKFEPSEAEEFLQLTMAGIFMNKDVGSVASAVGALRACASWLEHNGKDREQFLVATRWAESRANVQPGRAAWEN